MRAYCGFLSRDDLYYLVPLLNLRDVERRIFDIMASSILRGFEVKTWVYEGKGLVTLPFYAEAVPDSLHVFKTIVEIPSSQHKWYLKLVLSGNALLKVNGEAYAGFDEAHTYTSIEHGTHEFEVEVSVRGLFGVHDWRIVFERAVLIEVMPEVMDTGVYLLGVLNFVEALPRDSEIRSNVERLLYETLREVNVNPSLEQIALLHILLYENVHNSPRRDIPRERWDFNWLSRVYGYGVLKGVLDDIEKNDPEIVLAEVRRVRRELWKWLEELIARYPKIGLIHAAGHSHVDAAWLWPIRETREKLRRTFSTVLRLAETHGVVYVQSSAQYYEWIEKTDKRLLERIVALVKSGKWVPIGGMWVESDTNIVEGESLARQFLYGQRYFLERFGKLSKIGWLPDSFGFSGNLPQLLKKSGIEVFVTHKVMWNDTNEFPYHTFRWKGVDGTSILAQILITGYDEPATPASIYNYWSRYKQKDVAPVLLYTYGYGDGGGGPTEEMLKYIELFNKLPNSPWVRAFDEESFIESLKRFESTLPEWQGELYLEFHRGVYTTNLEIKRLVAEAEVSLVTAEAASTTAEILSGKHLTGRWRKLNEMWKTLLLSGFHDILPGSSVREVYEEVGAWLQDLISRSKEIVKEAVRELSVSTVQKDPHLVLFTVIPWKHYTVLRVPKTYGIPEGFECQEIGDEYVVVLETGPIGFRTYRLSDGGCNPRGERVKLDRWDGEFHLENEYLKLSVSGNGDISSIRIRDGPELLREPAKLLAHIDKPGVFDAWEVTNDFLVQGEEMVSYGEPKVSTEGPIVSCVDVSKFFEKSRIEQRICVYAGIPVVEIRNRISWLNKGVLVKHWFRTTIQAKNAVYEIPFGAVERPTGFETNTEKAMFEAPALRWVDVSDGNKGLAIIAPTRHGYSLIRGDVGLSLIRSPVFPNPWSDIGDFEVTYYLYPHRGDYVDAQVPRIAREITYKPFSFTVDTSFDDFEVVNFDPPTAILTAFKRAHDGKGYIARVFNPYGKSVKLKVGLGFVAKRVIEVDILELSTYGVLAENTNLFELSLHPFEIKTLMMELEDSRAPRNAK